jgi:anaerobic magnesium-protoporphyrin IX monomethyl ester cyclase
VRVLLIQAPLGRKQKPVYPLGLAYVADALPDQHEVQILDANLLTQPEIQETIARLRPDLIGLGLRNVDTTQSHDRFSYFRHFPPFVSWMKQLSIKSPLVVGGSGFSLFPREVMEACPEIDFGVELEGEATFPALLERLNHPESVPGVYYRGGGEVRHSGTPDLPDFAALPSPHRILDPRPYQEEAFQLGIQTKRGCAHRCLYCTYPSLNGRKIRQRHPRLVVNDLQHLAMKQGIKRFAFADSIFNEPREHAEQICREMVQRSLGLKWTA